MEYINHLYQKNIEIDIFIKNYIIQKLEYYYNFIPHIELLYTGPTDGSGFSGL